MNMQDSRAEMPKPLFSDHLLNRFFFLASLVAHERAGASQNLLQLFFRRLGDGRHVQALADLGHPQGGAGLNFLTVAKCLG